MRCGRVKKNISAFLDGHLGAREAIDIKCHLDACPGCRKEAELLRTVWDLLKEYSLVVPSSNFKARFWNKVCEEESARERKPAVFELKRLRPIFAPALAFVGAILIAVNLYNMRLLAGNIEQRPDILTKISDIRMFEKIDFVEEFDVIRNMGTLEDFEVINTMATS